MCFNTPAKLRFRLVRIDYSSVASCFGVTKHFILTVFMLCGRLQLQPVLERFTQLHTRDIAVHEIDCDHSWN
jgi:Trk-type K+ transport system membrane component